MFEWYLVRLCSHACMIIGTDPLSSVSIQGVMDPQSEAVTRLALSPFKYSFICKQWWIINVIRNVIYFLCVNLKSACYQLTILSDLSISWANGYLIIFTNVYWFDWIECDIITLYQYETYETQANCVEGFRAGLKYCSYFTKISVSICFRVFDHAF